MKQILSIALAVWFGVLASVVTVHLYISIVDPPATQASTRN